MGYSARYHVASLAAVFLALAIGILIGAEFGDDVVSGTAQSLENSLTSDLDDANARIEEVEAQLARERDFSRAAFPVLVDGVLRGQRIAVVALGSPPDELRGDITDTLDPSGGSISQVAVVREPPDLGALAEAAGRRPRELERDDSALTTLADRYGRSLVEGGKPYEESRDALLSGFSGETGRVDGVLVVRDRPGDLDEDDADATATLEEGVIEGMVDTGVPVVGVQRTDASDSSTGFFESRGLSTVDDLDLAAGRVAAVFALRGAQGNFGVGENADTLLPDLLNRPRVPRNQ